MRIARPFIKWAGGKTRLLPDLRRFRPTSFNTYFEPFLGGGAFFFDLAPICAVLGDSNGELLCCYEIVRDCPAELLSALDKFKVSEAEYYRIRAIRPEALSKVERAARFIYLNKTCYNGLYRVNKAGQFNTPRSGTSKTIASIGARFRIRRASDKNRVQRIPNNLDRAELGVVA
jgi:DNA adenine methylase